MGTMIIPILQMRKLRAQSIHIPFSSCHSYQGINPGLPYSTSFTEELPHIALVVILPVDKADHSIQLWFSTCKYAISCLSHNKYASY